MTVPAASGPTASGPAASAAAGPAAGPAAAATVGAVVIGRNEGARLVACLQSLQGQVARIVYVDSGSTDDSRAAAARLGAEVVVLDPDQPFTAARARNTGFARLCEGAAPPGFVQFVDGDCQIVPGWLPVARDMLARHPDLAVVCGRRRERFPERSVYNRLADAEWNTPVGEARACGGDAMMRSAALSAVGGYDPRLIAGEEPELCVRLRAAGWRIWRHEAEMTLHDAAMTRLGQWWQRSRRGGYAYAQGAAMHGAPPERHGVRELRRILAWGMALPLVAVLGGLLVSPLAGGALLLAYPAQVLRLWRREGDATRALFLTLAKFPEAQGVLTYLWRRMTGAQPRLIEYK